MLLILVVELEYVRQSILIFARLFPWLIFLERLIRNTLEGPSHLDFCHSLTVWRACQILFCTDRYLTLHALCTSAIQTTSPRKCIQRLRRTSLQSTPYGTQDSIVTIFRGPEAFGVSHTYASRSPVHGLSAECSVLYQHHTNTTTVHLDIHAFISFF